MSIFSGNAHPVLAQEICKYLDCPLGRSRVTQFSDGETFAVIEENVRGVDTYVVQPTCEPANDRVIELLIMADALRRASARSITAVIPYYGYARQDRKVAPRTPITAKLIAELLVASGVDRVVAVDLHAGQIQGFFNIPFDHLYAMPALLESHLIEHYPNAVVVSPDAGGVERARAYSKRLKGTLAIIDKRREKANESEVMNIIGDVKGKQCIIVDDIMDTAGTMCNAARALMEAGAASVSASVSHAVLSGPAIHRINDSPLDEVIVTNSVPVSEEKLKACPKIKVISIAPLLAEAIRRIHHSDSVSSLFV
ncbi:MAG: ribose-phosphate pyrophosphokinase [Myxococcales bacterium]|nr:ribose-phosphate pyrophosphokinase [Myxococcales bacterium]